MNVLTKNRLGQLIPWWPEIINDDPTWVRLIREGEKIPVHQVGLLRGLFWQPTRVELVTSGKMEKCSCCGEEGSSTYSGFKKEQLRYTVEGIWPHPHSPRFNKSTTEGIEESFVSFNSIIPSWTQLGRFVIQRQIDGIQEGQEPAAVIQQAKGLLKDLNLNIGGYANQQAKILKRRHELIFLPNGWSDQTDIINSIVIIGLEHLDALDKSLRIFSKGLKETKKKKKIKGAGVKIYEIAKEQFYRRTEDMILDILACLDFTNHAPQISALGERLRVEVVGLFEESVRPYLSDPNLIHTMAVSRQTLRKRLKELKPQQEGGADGERK
jgi:CRISPR system Cascade subunit CasA